MTRAYPMPIRSVAVLAAAVTLGLPAAAAAGPGYEQTRPELEQVMEDLIAWLPGAWDSAPQIHYERTVHMPAGGEHERWHRTFARIDAPQVGEVVFYGQINADGRDGPIIAGSQVLYKAVIDEKLGAVNIFGQGPADPEKYENLHDRPELWGEVRMRDPGALNCDFIWRRDGNQLFGVLQGNTLEKQQYGPGTCAFISQRTGEEFKADAEWVLTPEQLWLYDNNWSGGMLFLGREDRTHIKLYRSRPYRCTVKDADGTRALDAHDRGYETEVTGKDGQVLKLALLRADYLAQDGYGLDDRLRLTLRAGDEKSAAVAETDAAPLAKTIKVKGGGVEASCTLQDKFPPMARAE